MKDKNETLLQYTLWQLYHIENDLSKYHKVLDAHKKKIKDLQKSRKTLTDQLTTKKTEQNKFQKTALTAEQKIRTVRKKLDERKPEMISVREEISLLEERIASNTAIEQRGKENQKEHKRLIKELQTKLAEAEEEAKNFEEELENQMEEDYTLSPENQQEFSLK